MHYVFFPQPDVLKDSRTQNVPIYTFDNKNSGLSCVFVCQSTDNALNSIFTKRNHVDKYAAVPFTFKIGKTLLTPTKYVIKFSQQHVKGQLPKQLFL